MVDNAGRDQEEPDTKPSKFWLNQIDAAWNRDKMWRERAEKVIARYHDDRDSYQWVGGAERRINILWSNTEVLQANLLARIGTPDVRRDYPQPGAANKIARTVALILERNLASCLNRYDPKAEISDSVKDMLLTGRGQCWIDYEPQIVNKDGMEKIAYQKAEINAVCWQDFLHGPGKKWRDVRWVARLHLFTRDDLRDKWPDHADRIPCSYTLIEGKGRDVDQGEADFKRSRVWEVWDKKHRARIYVAQDYDTELERTEDPLGLEGFFPCPQPLYSRRATDDLTPRPEFLVYKDQAEELDRVNTRVWKLIEQLKFRGVRFAGLDGQDSLSDIDNLQDGQFLPIKNFQALSQGGGLKEAFQTIDLAPIVAAIQGASQRAVELIQTIYDVTGISDVIRGSTDPNETATAVAAKSRFGSQRLQHRQEAVQRFVRDLVAIKGEIIAEHFEREQLSAASGIDLPTEQERAQAQQFLSMVEQMQQQAEMAQQAQQQPGPPPMLGHNNGPSMEQEAPQEMAA